VICLANQAGGAGRFQCAVKMSLHSLSNRIGSLGIAVIQADMLEAANKR
jgi:hypothetical protein